MTEYPKDPEAIARVMLRTEGGPRCRIDSAALRFVPLAELESAGYGRYAPLFTGVVGA